MLRKSFTHRPLSLGRHVLVSAIATTLAAAAAAPAVAQQGDTQPRTLRKVDVQADADAGYKPERASSSKYTEPLRDTPQTVQVVPAKVIEDQNQFSLYEMLRNVPGITFSAAEGGNSFGDAINLRGNRADNDIQVDGIRDSAQTSRTDPFNLEQLEVTKGASSVYSGSGAISGTINMVSKAARNGDFARLSAGVGSDNYFRSTLDANRQLSDTTAIRVNLMAHENDVAGRDEVWAERWGAAVSLAFGLQTDTRLTLNYLHQENDRVPDRGLPWRRPAGGLAAGSDAAPVPVNRSTYFGWSNLDREDAVIDNLTGIFEKDFGESLTLRNTTRYGETSNYSHLVQLGGRLCVDGAGVAATNGNPLNPTCAPGESSYTPSNPANARDDETTIIANVTDFTWGFTTGSVEHTLVAGLAITREKFERTSLSNVYPEGAAAADYVTVRDLYNPGSTAWTGPVNYVPGNVNSNKVNNEALYVFDTLRLNEQWLLNAALRYERHEAVYDTFNRTAATTSRSEATDHLFSGRVGVVYKPVENGSIYLAYGNSTAPSAATVIASCSATGANANCNVDPEEISSYELGTKWDFLDNRLGLTAAVFRNDKTNARVNSGDPDIPTQVLDGESRVDGIELGLTGSITPNWSLYASYAYLDSEVLQSISDAQRAANVIDAQAGNAIAFTPEQSGNIWTTYTLPFGLEIGYGINHVGKYYTESTGVNDSEVPSYTLHNAMLSYRLGGLNLRLNVNNVTDTKYWTAVHVARWGNPGAERSFVLTTSYDF